MWQESQENEEITSAIPCEIIQSHHGNRANVYGQVNESLAVSNAVELVKIVFLSTSTRLQAPNLLADILRRYSEHDLIAAFNYLREKKIMVNCSQSHCLNDLIAAFNYLR